MSTLATATATVLVKDIMSLLATLANFGSSSSAVEATPSTGAWYEAFFPVAHNEVCMAHRRSMLTF